MRSFSQWTKQDVEETFLIKKGFDQTFWSDSTSTVTTIEKDSLAKLSRKLLHHIHDWNEEELKMHFIAFLLEYIDFFQEKYTPFFERELIATCEDGQKLGGKVDFLVASGSQTPKEPYFFIHEYKRQIDSPNDPLGQLLAEMVAAQLLNKKPHPIYGAYIMGRHWYFVLLDEKVYHESLAYDATKEEITEIVDILRKIKTLIDNITAA